MVPWDVDWLLISADQTDEGSDFWIDVARSGCNIDDAAYLPPARRVEEGEMEDLRKVDEIEVVAAHEKSSASVKVLEDSTKQRKSL